MLYGNSRCHVNLYVGLFILFVVVVFGVFVIVCLRFFILFAVFLWGFFGCFFYHNYAYCHITVNVKLRISGERDVAQR